MRHRMRQWRSLVCRSPEDPPRLSVRDVPLRLP